MVLWTVAALGLVVALVSLAAARRASRKLETLTQSYWELRYDYTRLRSQVARLDPEQAEREAAHSTSSGQAESSTAPAGSPAVSFVPLSSMKKKANGT